MISFFPCNTRVGALIWGNLSYESNPITAAVENANGRYMFRSKEHDDIATRPYLEVVYIV